MQDHGHMSPHQSTSCPHVCCSLCVGTIAKHDVNVIQCMCSEAQHQVTTWKIPNKFNSRGVWNRWGKSLWSSPLGLVRSARYCFSIFWKSSSSVTMTTYSSRTDTKSLKAPSNGSGEYLIIISVCVCVCVCLCVCVCAYVCAHARVCVAHCSSWPG